MISSTPKNSVKPTATSVYIMPSMRPFMMYCERSPTSIFSDPVRTAKAEAGRSWCRPSRCRLFLSGKLALARGVFAVLPLHELGVLHHIFGDQCHGIQDVIVALAHASDQFAMI